MAGDSTDWSSRPPGRGRSGQGPADADGSADLAQPDSDSLAVALAHHQSGRTEQAEAAYRRLLDKAPCDPTALYLCAMLNFETGRPDEADGLFQRLVEARPDHAEAWFALANLRFWRDDRDAAVDAYGRAIALDPGHLGARLNLVRALRDAGRFDEAQAACEAALAAGGDPASGNLLLGGVLVAAGRSGEAASAFAAACALDPANLEARLGLATALIGDGRPAEALAAAEAAIMADDSLAEAWMLRGGALRALRRLAQAASALERAVELDPGRAAARVDLGAVYAELDRAAQAEAQLQAALAIDPACAEALASLGSVYMRAERKAQAERHFRRALEIDPTMVVPHQNLAALMAEQGRAAEARLHRDAAYGRQSLFVERAPDPLQTVLVLTAAEGGNTPHRFLLPPDRYTRLEWVIEYAGEGDAERLPPYDLVFNAIGDPDVAGPIAGRIEAFAAASGATVLNPPAKVARTHRHLTAGLLGDIDRVVVPRTVRLSAAEIAADGLAVRLEARGLALPLLLRPRASHGGRGLVRIEDADDLASWAAPDGDLYASAYHDFSSADGWHRKYRVIFVDRRPYPYHLAIAADWMVHHGTAEMADDPERLAEELRFLDDPEAVLGGQAMAAIAAIGERLDLDYAGVDFSVLPDDRVLVFEANAAMLVHTEAEDGPLARKNPYVRSILDAFADMLARKAALTRA